jgi:flagellar biosynthetic protein FliS
MLYQQSRSAYQLAAASGATQAGILQLVYTHLAQDLLTAAEAIKQGDIPKRCVASKHAFRLLGHLESWSEEVQDDRLAQSLRTFYAMVRTVLITQQAQLDPSKLEECAQLVLATRAAWRTKEESVPTGGVNTESGSYARPERLSLQA